MINNLQKGHWISLLVCGILPLGSTLVRLFLRRRRLWWDDTYALFSTLALILSSVCFAVDVQQVNVSQSMGTFIYYSGAATFYATIWLARLSILFSIIRVDPDVNQRKILIFVAISFAMACILLIGQVVWVCDPDNTWQEAAVVQCPLSTQVVAFQMTSYIIADFILIAAPVKVFQDLLHTGLRRRLLIIFSASIMTTAVSIVHSVYILTAGGIESLIAGTVEGGVSVCVCNLPVFVIASMRLPGVENRDDLLGTSRVSMDTLANLTMISLNDRIVDSSVVKADN